MPGRRAGLLIPLFSCPSTASWGVGEIADLPTVTTWLASAGLRVLQLLPVNEMAPGQQSPYSAITAMAIDPIFIRLPGVPEFDALGGEASLSRDDTLLLAHVRASVRVEHVDVRRLKYAALRAAFDRFFDHQWCRDGDRARAFKAFVRDQAWWLDDYSLFRAIHVREGERPWTEWPEPLQRRDVAALDRARAELGKEILFHQYLQWLAAGQWAAARRAADGVELFGDLPFMVDTDSADVWARQHEFSSTVTIGAPPDAFSAEGQDWGTPLYLWDVIAQGGFGWLRQRARRCADLFDGYRIDHLVGFYRTFGRPKDGAPSFFSPAAEADQLALGERVLSIFREPGSEIVAEDLGTVPDFVRASLARLGVPGFKVLRWERHWHTEGQPFRDPADYPATSVAVSGTHDTEPLAVWWEHASADERRMVGEAPTIRRIAGDREFSSASFADIRDVLIEALFASGSDLLLLPIQDVFGWTDRINDPAVVAETNWVYRLPWPVDRLDDHAEARDAKARLRGWAERYQRS